MQKISLLLDHTRLLLKTRPVTIRYKDIQADTGLSIRWLEEFATGGIIDPGVIKVETLHQYLSGKEITL